MGEIKSTLDLVLEKTKHLSLAPEERQAQEQQTFIRKLKGLIQKLQEGQIKPHVMYQELESLKETHNVKDIASVQQALADLLEINSDPQTIFSVLSEQGFTQFTPLEEVFQSHQQRVDDARRKNAHLVLEKLQQQHAISGSAVLPHLAADETYQTEIKRIEDESTAALQEAKTQLFPA